MCVCVCGCVCVCKKFVLFSFIYSCIILNYPTYIQLLLALLICKPTYANLIYMKFFVYSYMFRRNSATFRDTLNQYLKPTIYDILQL